MNVTVDEFIKYLKLKASRRWNIPVHLSIDKMVAVMTQDSLKKYLEKVVKSDFEYEECNVNELKDFHRFVCYKQKKSKNWHIFTKIFFLQVNKVFGNEKFFLPSDSLLTPAYANLSKDHAIIMAGRMYTPGDPVSEKWTDDTEKIFDYFYDLNKESISMDDFF